MAVLRGAERAWQICATRVARTALVLLLLLAGLSPVNAGAQVVAAEYQVKAAYLLNFARFVEWPARVLPPSAPMQIAIVGADPFGGALEEVLRGQSVNGHSIQLRHQRWDDVLTPYEIVFISASEEPHLPEILRRLGNSSVLTVSDIDRFSLRGGAIEFRTVGNRVRFDINRTSAITADLSISSKLLSVARAVRESSAVR
ncbi:MAG TPA: YfiR family protein [Gemmatimonadaceae bacterium]